MIVLCLDSFIARVLRAQLNSRRTIPAAGLAAARPQQSRERCLATSIRRRRSISRSISVGVSDRRATSVSGSDMRYAAKRQAISCRMLPVIPQVA